MKRGNLLCFKKRMNLTNKSKPIHSVCGVVPQPIRNWFHQPKSEQAEKGCRPAGPSFVLRAFPLPAAALQFASACLA